jgi:hypothetical protein
MIKNVKSITPEHALVLFCIVLWIGGNAPQHIVLAFVRNPADHVPVIDYNESPRLFISCVGCQYAIVYDAFDRLQCNRLVFVLSDRPPVFQ